LAFLNSHTKSNDTITHDGRGSSVYQDYAQRFEFDLQRARMAFQCMPELSERRTSRCSNGVQRRVPDTQDENVPPGSQFFPTSLAGKDCRKGMVLVMTLQTAAADMDKFIKAGDDFVEYRDLEYEISHVVSAGLIAEAEVRARLHELRNEHKRKLARAAAAGRPPTNVRGTSVQGNSTPCRTGFKLVVRVPSKMLAADQPFSLTGTRRSSLRESLRASMFAEDEAEVKQLTQMADEQRTRKAARKRQEQDLLDRRAKSAKRKEAEAQLGAEEESGKRAAFDSERAAALSAFEPSDASELESGDEGAHDEGTTPAAEGQAAASSPVAFSPAETTSSPFAFSLAETDCLLGYIGVADQACFRCLKDVDTPHKPYCTYKASYAYE